MTELKAAAEGLACIPVISKLTQDPSVRRMRWNDDGSLSLTVEVTLRTGEQVASLMAALGIEAKGTGA